jgi:hypothetical protein
MEITKIFRILVWSYLALFAVSIAAAFFEPDLPEPVSEYLDGDGAGPFMSALYSGTLGMQIALGALFLGFLVACIASLFGLLEYRRWARAIFIATNLLGFALIPSMGASLSTPLQSGIDTLLCMLDGAILVMLLVDPIKAKFAKPMVAEAR